MTEKKEVVGGPKSNPITTLISTKDSKSCFFRKKYRRRMGLPMFARLSNGFSFESYDANSFAKLMLCPTIYQKQQVTKSQTDSEIALCSTFGYLQKERARKQ